MDAPQISKQVILNTVRIVQEALQNALFRANSKLIIFKCEVNADGSLTLYMENSEGKALKDSSRKGFGIKNMFARAKNHNIELTLESTDDGAKLILKIPGQKV